jgi:hypothetical protein
LIGAVVFLLMLILPASGHVPVLPGNHNSLATAVQLEDPAITYAIYGTLHEAGETDYYQVTLQKDAHLRFMVSTPFPGTFAPWLVIAGPGISPQGTVPSSLTLPEGDSVIVVTGTRPAHADYEPFTPISGYQTALYDGLAPATGTYIIAVYTPADTGPYTLATGTLEAFTVPEWIMVPVNQVQIRFWQEQSPLLIFGPYLAVLIIGLYFLFRRPEWRRMNPAALCGFVAGLLFLGTGAATLLQTGIALQTAPAGLVVLVTLVFAATAIGAGAAAVRISIRLREPVGARFRISMACIGFVGVAAWAGILVGPVLAFAAAVMPRRYR